MIKKKSSYYLLLSMLLLLTLVTPERIYAMHIMEGYLPPSWCIFWSFVSLPFFILGILRIKKLIADQPENLMLIGVGGAFSFVLSALKLPSLTGSTSHATGIGLGTILFGPFVMTVVGTIVLLFQALLLAHGGLTTLGANVFSMAVMGSLIAYGIYKGCRKLNIPLKVTVFFAAAIGDLATYIVTSGQLALAFPDVNSGFLGAFAKFTSIFAITQIPLAIAEGILTVLIIDILYKYNKENIHIFQTKNIGKEVN